MLHKILCLSALVVAFSLSARPGVFDSRSRTVLMKAHHERQRAKADKARSMSAPTEADSLFVPAILEITDPSGVDSLEALGAIIMRQRENFVVCCIPESQAAGLDSVRFINSGSLSSAASQHTDRLRQFTNVDAVHQGQPLSSTPGYDGSGVVTGFCDIGFDPGHIAFRDRVPLMIDYTMRRGQRRVYDNPDDMPLTDRPDEFHATHVANILAGGRENNPYYGVAPGSTLIATTSDLYDAAFVCGIEDIIDYAREHGMPAVVNLSMGCQLGPRDGTDIINRYLDLLGREAIICFSAGNNGSYNVSFSHTFEDDDSTGTLFETKLKYNGMHIMGATDIWSADSRGVEISVIIYDMDTRTLVYESPRYGGEFAIDLSSGENAIPTAYYALSNQMYIAGGVDKSNGRYCIAMSYDMATDIYRTGNPWARYYFGFKIYGRDGVSVDVNCDGEYSLMRGQSLPGLTSGDGTLSISNYACGHGVISVGSYNTRNTIDLVGGGQKTFDFNVGEVTAWSGHGTLRDGRVLPDICAPGNYVVSATSRAFYERYPTAYPLASEWTDQDGTVYRWHGECGTSMSSPAAAGTFALWLQADPSLTRDDIVSIARSTAAHDMPDGADPRWGGSGRLDAKAGLDLIIRRLSSTSTSINYKPYVSVLNGMITVTVPGLDNPVFTVTDMQGRVVNHKTPLTPGIYLVTISLPNCPTTVKVAV